MATTQTAKKKTETAKPSQFSKEEAQTVQVWERQPDESIQAYARFVSYRNTPATDRSIRKLGVSMQLAARWSKRHRWVRRTAEYDAWLLGLSDDLAQHAVLSSRRQLLRLGSASLAKATQTVQELNATKLDAHDVMTLAKVGESAIERSVGSGLVKPTVAPTVVHQTSVQFGLGLPSWASASETKQLSNEIVVEGSEKVLAEANGAQGAHAGAAGSRQLSNSQSPVPMKRLRERLIEAPTRVPD